VQCIAFPAIAPVYKLLIAVLCVVMAQFEPLLAGYERERERERVCTADSSRN